MLSKIILSIVVAVIVALVCILVGAVLSSTGVRVLTSIGDFLETYSTVIGILAGIWYYFKGNTFLR